jgi:hypothetical protein
MKRRQVPTTNMFQSLIAEMNLLVVHSNTVNDACVLADFSDGIYLAP